MKSISDRDREHNYIPDNGRAVSVRSPLTPIRQYLGELDADKEWNRSEPGQQYDAYIRFLSTDSYKRFIEEESLILVGRTGSGKTAILNRYMYDVFNGKINKIRRVLKLNLKEYIMQLSKYVEINENQHRIQDEIEKNIQVIVNLAIMQDLAKYQMRDDKVTFHADVGDYMKKINEYLKSQEINNSSVLEKCINELDKLFDDTTAGKLASAVVAFTKFAINYKTPAYEEAVNALYSYLKYTKNDFLVLIDSMDEYDRNRSSVLVLKALIETCYKFYNENIRCHIQLKIALPSEIYAEVVTSLPEKHQSNTIFIEWKYRDIVKMIAIRVLYYVKHSDKSVLHSLMNGYEYDDFYDDYKKSKECLSSFLPKKTSTNLSMCFDSIAYCIRHTQRKPRQVMKIFNALIDTIEKKSEPKYFYINDGELSRCVHMVQSDMISDALTMYNSFADYRILDICEKILMNREAVIPYKKMMNYVKEASNIYRKLNLDESEVLEILLESGILGCGKVEYYVEPNSTFFQNDHTVKIIKALFEYQIRDRLRVQKEDRYIIHPMCYEYFTNLVDRNAMIYPEPIDDDEDEDVLNALRTNSIEPI